MQSIFSSLTDLSAIEVHALAERRSDYCIIVGVWNEGERITKQIERMQAIRPDADIIVADGGSTDGATSKEALAGKVTTLIVDKRKIGLSGQYQSALAHALDAGYKGMIMVDGNGKDGVEATPKFIEALKDGAHMVQGSRFLRGGQHLNTPWVRYFAIRVVFCPFMYCFTGYAYTDGINGFKAVSRELLLHPGVQPFRPIFNSYSLQYYLNYRAPKLGLKVAEVPVSRNYPPKEAIPTKIHGIKAYVKILKMLARTCLGQYNPK